MIPLIGVTVAERLRDRGLDCCICFDDLSKHSKSYRQISLILGKIPSRDAYPADIFNIHSSILERCGKLKYSYNGGSISALPIIETINSDITEYIATNVISITDGQFYTNKKLFLESIRPSVDSAHSVSRIGSNAQTKFMKVYSVGIKNLITYYRNVESATSNSTTNIGIGESIRLNALNLIFYQDHLQIFPIETSMMLLLYYRYWLGISVASSYKNNKSKASSKSISIIRANRNISLPSLIGIYNIEPLLCMLATDFYYLYYLVFISKYNYSI